MATRLPLRSPAARRRLVLAWALVVLLAAGVPGAGGIGFVGQSTFNAQTTSLTLAKPAAVGVGDLMLALLAFHSGSALTLTPPSGWTLVLRTDNGAVIGAAAYTRIATAGEPASYAWTLSSNVRATGGLLAYNGVVSASAVAASAGATGNSASVTAPAVTATETGGWLVTHHAMRRVTSFAPPAGMTERYDVSTSGGNSVTGTAADVPIAATGSPGAKTATAANSDRWVAQSFLLTPVKVAFDAAAASGSEAGVAPAIAVRLSGTTTAAVTVSWAVTGGNATAGEDFAPSTGVVTVPAGASTANLVIAVVDDALVEPDETIVFTLSGPSKAILGTLTTHTYTILNDDAAPGVPEVTVTIVGSDGGAPPVSGWGGWDVDPGATEVEAPAYLKITNVGTVAPVRVVVDFTGGSFVGTEDPTATIAIDGNLRFGVFVTTKTDTTLPGAATYAWGGPSGAGSVTVNLTATDSMAFVAYRIVAVPALLPGQPYTGAFTVTEL